MAQNTPVAFNDPVHGYIEFEPLLVRIIHTSEFQRMKDIKQLGASYWVYPGASHNRFEHSLGTAYLAGKMIETLRDIHRGQIEITDQEVLCVKIAALCHDLGHGPFSHVFDKQMKDKLFNLHPDEDRLREWEHEDASCAMFDHIVNVNPNLMAAIGEDERQLVKELIKGKKPGEDEVTQITTVNGVDYPKWFLFEIVANKRNGIDCDKFDYFARDCLNLGVKSNFDHLRYFQNIRVLLVDGQLRLCCRDKLAFNIYEMFHTRWSLHHRVYQHKTTKAIEDMITDALVLLDDKYQFSQAIFDMARYAKLTDSILYEIIRSEDQDDNTRTAQQIIRRIQRRDLYKFCGKILPRKLPDNVNDALGVANHMVNLDHDNGILGLDDIFVSFVTIHFGMQENDPVQSVRFYDKDLREAPTPNVSEMLPQTFSETYVRVYSKTREEAKLDAINAIVTQINTAPDNNEG